MSGVKSSSVFTRDKAGLHDLDLKVKGSKIRGGFQDDTSNGDEVEYQVPERVGERS